MKVGRKFSFILDGAVIILFPHFLYTKFYKALCFYKTIYI